MTALYMRERNCKTSNTDDNECLTCLTAGHFNLDQINLQHDSYIFMLWWDLKETPSIADGLEMMYKCKIISKEGYSSGMNVCEISCGCEPTTASTRCAILARYVNALQAPSRRHPQSAMRQTGTMA
jgi:hypothetical protein